MGTYLDVIGPKKVAYFCVALVGCSKKLHIKGCQPYNFVHVEPEPISKTAMCAAGSPGGDSPFFCL